MTYLPLELILEYIEALLVAIESINIVCLHECSVKPALQILNLRKANTSRSTSC